MTAPKNPRIRNNVSVAAIATIVAIAFLVAGTVFVFRSHRPAQTENARASQTAAAAPSHSRSADTDAPRSTTPVAVPAEPASGDNNATTASQTSKPFTLQLPATTAATATATAAATTASTDDPAASLTPKERAAFDKIADAPAAFRDKILALKPAARARVLKSIAANPPPKADYASLRVTSGGLLYYVCEFPESGPGASPGDLQAATATGTPLPASVPITQPPALHSRPGSRNVLYLDFTGNADANGQSIGIVGTAWNGDPSDSDYVPVFLPKPYKSSGDTDPNTFNDQTQVAIMQIWERVSEYYSAFDVDVTTERPDDLGISRTVGHAVITSGKGANNVLMPDGNDAGGIGLLNVFGEDYYAVEGSPVFVYYDNLGNDISNIAYAAAHEFGHNVGLSHQGPGSQPVNDSDGTDFGYYAGHSGGGVPSWAPIMGAGYGMTVIQWSKGDYYSGNNHEDAIAIIAGKLGYRGELGATTLPAALPISMNDDGSIGGEGVIRNASFSHYYTLALSGSVNFKLLPARSVYTTSTTVFGSTDLTLAILNSAGGTIATNNPANLTTASLGVTLSGTTYVRITSGGAGSPMSNPPTGYTAYGSIGQYTLSTDLVYTNPSLNYALNSDLDWTNDPDNDADWFGQYATKHNATGYLGLAAAQSGALASGQAGSMSATVEGTGTFTYWWKNTGAVADALVFATTDDNAAPVLRDTLHGTNVTTWTFGTTIITTPGTHDLIFTYDKASPNSTTSTAWVADVDWTPSDWKLTLAPDANEVLSGSDTFALTINTPKKWTAESYDPSWITISRAAGTGTTTITVTTGTNTTASPRKSYIVVTSAGITRSCAISQPVYIPFATALNDTLAWTTGGNANWTTQTIFPAPDPGEHPYFNPQTVARTGIIYGSGTDDPRTYQKTWLQTTVTGTGVLKFYWNISSEPESTDDMGTWGDFLYFTIDGLEQARISGTLGAKDGWEPRTYAIDGSGTHTLRWLYEKDPAESTGADGAWLAQVTWIPEGATLLNLTPDTKQVPATSGQFTLGVDANVSWTAIADASWLAITPASGNTSVPVNVIYAANTATAARAATITLTGGGTFATCLVTQAAAATTGTTGGGGSNPGSGGSGGGGGGGGAPSLLSLLALALLLGARAAKRKT